MQKTDLALDHLKTLLLTSKRADGLSNLTLRWYENGIGGFCAWLERNGHEPQLANLTLDLARAYTVELQERVADAYHPKTRARNHRLSDATINCYLRALRAFSHWLYEEGYTTADALARLKPPRLTKKVKDVLTRDEVVAIVTSLNPHTEIGARDQAIFLTLLDTGMRASELCGLRLGDLHLEEGYAKVLGKGRKERPVRIGALAAKAIRFYLLHWRKPARPAIDQVFLTCRGVTRDASLLAPEPGEPLCAKAMGRMIKRIGCAAGAPRLHPHLLRHTFACGYLVAYHDPFALKSLLGHTTLAMTNHYCAAVQEMEIVRADKGSLLDTMDLHALSVNRRGRLPQKSPAATRAKR